MSTEGDPVVHVLKLAGAILGAWVLISVVLGFVIGRLLHAEDRMTAGQSRAFCWYDGWQNRPKLVSAELTMPSG